MPITTSHDLQRERLLGACRLSAVANAAGVLDAAWQSTTSPRVACSNGQGYVGGLHRGRLPFIEVWQLPDQKWDKLTARGCGTITTSWRVRVHVSGPSWQVADSLARAVAQVALAAIRSDDYLEIGDDSIGELVASPLGFHLDVDLSFEHTFDRSTYETDAIIGPLPPQPPEDIEPTDLAYVAAETVVGGRVVWYDPTAPGWRYADHTNPAHASVPLAVTLGTIMQGAIGQARFYGMRTDSSFLWTVPSTLWLGTNGQIVSVLPTGGFLREVARMVALNTIMIEPEGAVVLL